MVEHFNVGTALLAGGCWGVRIQIFKELEVLTKLQRCCLLLTIRRTLMA